MCGREIRLDKGVIVGRENRRGNGREETIFWRRGDEGEREEGGGGATEAWMSGEKGEYSTPLYPLD